MEFMTECTVRSVVSMESFTGVMTWMLFMLIIFFLILAAKAMEYFAYSQTLCRFYPYLCAQNVRK